MNPETKKPHKPHRYGRSVRTNVCPSRARYSAQIKVSLGHATIGDEQVGEPPQYGLHANARLSSLSPRYPSPGRILCHLRTAYTVS